MIGDKLFDWLDLMISGARSRRGPQTEYLFECGGSMSKDQATALNDVIMTWIDTHGIRGYCSSGRALVGKAAIDFDITFKDQVAARKDDAAWKREWRHEVRKARKVTPKTVYKAYLAVLDMPWSAASKEAAWVCWQEVVNA